MEIYGRLEKFMNVLIQKKLWGQILNTFIIHYLRTLLTSEIKKPIQDLKMKLLKDKEILFSFFDQQIGKNLIEETMKIIDELINFLSSEIEMIGMSCKSLREFTGPTFCINTAKALINLRVDFDRKTKNEAIESCKLMLDNCNKIISEDISNYRHSDLFFLLESDLQGL